MSAPPFCDVCGTHHHKHQAHKFATDAVHVDPVAVDESKWVMRGASSVDVSNDVSNAQQSSVVTHTSAERVRKWRERNADLNRERQREYMRKRRANG